MVIRCIGLLDNKPLARLSLRPTSHMGGLRWRTGYAKVAMLGIRSLGDQTYEG